MKRRDFIKNSLLATGAVAVGDALRPAAAAATTNAFNENQLPAWRGFNLRDFNSPDPFRPVRKITEEQLKWMRDWGFDFIRLPVAYPHYLKFDRTRNITPDEVYQIDEKTVNKIENLVLMAHQNGLHVSLNLHRAPGYCINAGFHEPYNLWKDKAAQDAFFFHWNFWAKRFKNVSRDKISFDLLNEPCMREDMNDQLSKALPIPVDLYKEVAEKATSAIRSENEERIILADGNYIGNDPVPELADLNISQSCRGYFPHAISHYRAPWASNDPQNMPVPVYPGKIGNREMNRQLLEEYYRPWIDLKNSGVGVHCGECGSWNKTPHAVVLSWFSDVTDILSSNGIGFALWEFIGDFGILNSGRADVEYQDWYGYQLDTQLLELIRNK